MYPSQSNAIDQALCWPKCILLHQNNDRDTTFYSFPRISNDFWMRAEAQEIDLDGNTTAADPPPYCLLLDCAAEAILQYNTSGSSLPTSADYVCIKEIPPAPHPTAVG